MGEITSIYINPSFIYLIFLAVMILIRIPYAKRYKAIPRVVSHQDYKDIALQALVGVGTGILPIMLIATDWFDFAYLYLPVWAFWVGLILLLGGIYFFWKSHKELGENWSPSMEIRAEHTLIKEGIYKYIRHPMYLSFGLWCIGMALFLGNWIVGTVVLFSIIPMYTFRMLKEEKMLVEEFGEAYKDYMNETKRLIPKIF